MNSFSLLAMYKTRKVDINILDSGFRSWVLHENVPSNSVPVLAN